MKTNRKYTPKLFDLSSVPLTKKYPHGCLLDPKKIKVSKTLTLLVGPSVSRNWLNDLVAQQEAMQGQVSVSVADDEDVGSDSENDLIEYSDPRHRTH